MTETDIDKREYLTLEEIQCEFLSMLKVAGQWLLQHGIRYSLSDGSLLGAARHKGFIPWDDDLDIYMPRPDYEKWLSLAEEFKADTGFGMRSRRDGSYHYPFSKITNPAICAQELSVEGDYEVSRSSGCSLAGRYWVPQERSWKLQRRPSGLHYFVWLR